MKNTQSKTLFDMNLFRACVPELQKKGPSLLIFEDFMRILNQSRVIEDEGKSRLNIVIQDDTSKVSSFKSLLV